MFSLPFHEFKQIVRNTPLISIDLIIENPEGKILLGMRNNSPAKGFWFVPGGRICKDEDFMEAFKRIARNETGIGFQLKDASFHGIYQHIHLHDNVAEDPSFNTHYLVIAYRIKLEKTIQNLPKEQHSDYGWFSIDEILKNSEIHQNTKNYFNGHPSFSE